MRQIIPTAALACAGCAGGEGARIDSTPINSEDLQRAALALASSGPLIEIRGTPSGGATREQVAAALRMPGGFPQRPFRLARPGEADPRFVLALGARAVDDGRIRRPGGAGGGAPERLEDSMAICTGTPSDASGVVTSPATRPNDPAFPPAVATLIQGMPQAADRPTRNPGSE